MPTLPDDIFNNIVASVPKQSPIDNQTNAAMGGSLAPPPMSSGANVGVSSQASDPFATTTQNIGLSEAQLSAMSQDNPDIKRQDDSVFNGSTYDEKGVAPPTGRGPLAAAMPGVGDLAESLWNNMTDPKQNTPENWAQYNTTGQPGPLGIGRTQKSVDPVSGNKSTYIVPPPGMTPMSRMVTGGVENAVQGAASLVEWAAKAVPESIPILGSLHSTMNLAHLLLQNDVTDDKINWVNENLPRVPAQNDIERAGQEIIGFAIGAAAGSGVVKTLTELPAGEQVVGKLAGAFLDRAAKINPVNALQKTQTFVKSALTEMAGQGVGGTVAMPPGTGSVTNMALGAATGGKVQLPDKVGQFLDNTISVGILKGLGFGMNATKKFAGDAILGASEGNERTNSQLVVNILKRIDPDLEGTSPEEFARRAKIFANTVGTHAKLDIPSMGIQNADRGPVAAMNLGAEDYVNQAYGFLKKSMSPEEWSKFYSDKVKYVRTEFKGVRDANMSNPAVSAGTSAMNETLAKGLKVAADSTATTPQIEQGVNTLAQGPIGAQNQVTLGIKSAENDLAQAKTAQGQAQNSVSPIQPTNPFGQTVDNSTERNAMVTSMGEAGANAKKEVDLAFSNTAGGYNYNANTMAKKIAAVVGGDSKLADLFKVLPTKSPRDQIAQVNQIKKNLSKFSIATLFKDIRPQLVEMRQNILNNGNSVVQTHGQADAIKDLIKQIDYEAANTKDPAFQEAMDKYVQYKGKFEPDSQLADFMAQARGADKRSYVYSDFLQHGRALLEKAFNGTDKSGETLKNIASVMTNTGDPQAKLHMAHNIIDYALANAGTSPQAKVTAQQLVGALKPYANQLKTLDQTTYQTLEDAWTLLTKHEDTVKGSSDMLQQVKVDSAKQMSKIEQDVAYKFIDKYSMDQGNPKPTNDYASVFKSIFNSADATKQLMSKVAGDPLTEKAIQGQYLRTMEDQLLTTRPEANAVESGKFVKTSSAAQLSKFDKEANDVPSQVMEEVFKNDPQKLSDLRTVIKELKLQSDTNQLRPQTYGPNTNVDNQRQRGISLLVTGIFGILNHTASMINKGTTFATRALMVKDKEMRQRVFGAFLSSSDSLTQYIDGVVRDSSKENVDNIVHQMLSLKPSNPLIKGAANQAEPETGPNLRPKTVGDIGMQTANALGTK